MKSSIFTTATALRSAGGNASKAGEIGSSAPRVIAERMMLATRAMIDPKNADHAEFARMIPEKTKAFSLAGLSWLRSSARIGARINTDLATEAISLAEAMVAISACKSVVGIMEIQSRFATAWFSRAVVRASTLGSLATASQSAALRPIHRTVTGNARRLGV